MTKPLIVLGAGGHARVVFSIAEASSRTVAAVIDEKRSGIFEHLNVTASIERLEPAVTAAAEFVIAVGNNESRLGWFSRYPNLAWTTLVHPSAIVDATVVLEPGVVVMHGAIVQRGARIGMHSIVNTGATIDHDCEIGAFTHVGPGATICGTVHIGERVLIGAGAVVIPNLKIHSQVTVGAGATVTKDVTQSGATVAGTPARGI